MPAFTCSLVTPAEAVFEKNVTSVTIPAFDGQVGILDHRAPLLTKLGYGKLTLEEESGGKSSYFIAGGFAQMQDNKLSVLTDEAIAVSELSADKAQAELDAAIAEAAETAAEKQIRGKKIERARGLLAVAKSE